ncbi:MAG: hypothetical protein LQ351_003391 [Letrouitia transgressa]|nr:MAG: hypothetical protein LQ351_003391 [Letrouitia transgressa]
MILTTNQVVNQETCPAPIDIIQEIIALTDEHGSASRFGSFSGAIYDTAWLSMISKVTSGHQSPLFPECFNYLLTSQQEDGAWGATASQVDGILNSLAGLLALATRRRSNQIGSLESSSLDWRIERSYLAIRDLLQDWDVNQSVHVGFEILVPSLLRQLESFDIHFDFPGHSTLMHLHDQKLRKFDFTLVYSTESTTLLHSLEAFVGLVDFDRVGHHCSEASGIFGSPAATAAYLINAAAWDDRAEIYLRTVVVANGKAGAVPSAYPTCLFEISWTLSTLLAPGLLSHQLTETEKERLGELLEDTLNQQAGVIGFAPGVLEDADDTARALMALQYLGKSTNPDRMIERFQTDSYFRTYSLEGSPSFSANCNVLISLLGYSGISGYQHHVEKAITFLLKAEESGPISDKWNLSPQYCRMLFVQALLSLLDRYNSNCLASLPTTIIYEQVPGSICRLLGQTLSTQKSDGSWADSVEITAYSLLTIAHCLSFPWTADLKGQLNDSISRGRKYLYTEYSTTNKLDYLWIEKVSYRSTFLYSTYCSAALNIDVIEYSWNSTIIDCFTLPSGVSKQMGYLFSNLPLFLKSKPASNDLVLIEAGQVSKRLKKSRDILFTRDDIPMTADKYIEFIPMIWVACNHKSGHILSANIVWEMVLLSLLNFQVDEYMESVVARIAESEISMLLALLERECDMTSGLSATVDAMTHDRDSSAPRKRQKRTWDEANNAQSDLPEQSTVARALTALSQFIKHVTQHKSLLQSPTSVRQEIAREVYRFLVAHIIHNQDNVLLAKSKSIGATDGLRYGGNERSYLEWVRSTASDDTSCPFSFLFFTSLISERGRNCFAGTRADYLSKCLCRHLATMCRQYNDYGSAKRDAEENNLNSLDFPEFQSYTNHAERSCEVSGSGLANGSGLMNGFDAPSARLTDRTGALEAVHNKRRSSESRVKDSIQTSAKDDLMAIAEFERSCMQLAMKTLIQISPAATTHKLQVFIDVTDMFGQIYVQKDIASRVKNAP